MVTVGVISLALGCVFLYIYKTRIRTMEDSPGTLPEAAPPTGDLTIENVRPGAVIHLDAVGVKSESFDAQITARHLHESDSERWTELAADRGGSTIYLTLERDDELSVTVTLAQPGVRALGKTAGVPDTDLGQLTDGRTLTYEGTTYTPLEHGHAIFYRDYNEQKPQEYEYWEFEDDDEEQFLTLVLWEDGTVEASHSVDLNPSFITVYSQS